MNEIQKHMLTMIEDGLVRINSENKEQLKDFALACFSASSPKKKVEFTSSKNPLKSFSMEKSKLAVMNKIRSDGGKEVFTSRAVDYLISRKYFTDFSTQLRTEPRLLAWDVLGELQSEGILEFSKNKKRVSIK